MKNLKRNIKFKIYEDGQSFLKENEQIFLHNPQTEIQTAFFILNAKAYQKQDKNNYAIRLEVEDDILFLFKCEPYNGLLYGSQDLVPNLVDYVIENELNIESILAEEELASSFLMEYQKQMGGSIKRVHQMKIMILEELALADFEKVVQCDSQDLKELALCSYNFHQEALQEEVSLEHFMESLKGKERNYYAYKVNNKIVSIASIARESEGVCAITHVYTLPEYRGKGYAKQVVAKTCAQIMALGKIPYLFVDMTNPISNHLYLSLGFQYLINQSQYQYEK